MTVLSIALTAVVALLAPRLPETYTATTRLLVTPALQIAAVGGRGILLGEISVIRSQRLLDALATRLQLSDDLEIRSPGGYRAALPWIRPGVGSRAAQGLRDRIEVAVERNSNVIAISATTRSPAKSARISAGLAELYTVDLQDRRLNAGLKQREWVARKLAALRPRVTKPAPQPAAETDRAAELRGRLRVARKRLAGQKQRLEQARGPASTRQTALAIREVRNSPLVQRLRGQLKRLHTQERDLAREKGELHPGTAALGAKIEALRTRIDREVERIVDGLEDRIVTSETEIRKLTQQAAEAHKSFESMQPKYADAAGESNDPNRARRTVLEEMRAPARLAAFQVSGVEFIERASTATARPSPPLAWQMGAGAILSILCAMLMARWRGSSGQIFRSVSELELELGAQVVASIPLVRGREVRAGIGNLVRKAPASPFAQCVRQLRSALRFRPGVQVVALAGPHPGIGNTTLSVALARLCALSGGRVVLVDGNLRAPGVAEATGVAGTAGLADVLSGQAELGRALLWEADSGLHILPANGDGTGTGLPVHQGALHGVIDLLRQSYDMVIVDIPTPEAGSLASTIVQLADVTILTAWRSRTLKPEIFSAWQALESCGARVAGIVLQKAGRSDGVPPFGLAAAGNRLAPTG